jgi:hypothetical protein
MIRFVWCLHHHGNGVMRPLYPREDSTKEYKGIWVCQQCKGHMQRRSDKPEDWEAARGSV